MHFSVPLVALLSVATSAFAAPAPTSSHSLAARGIRKELHGIQKATGTYICKVKDALKCFQRDMHNHLRIIEEDIREDFESWRSEMRVDFAYLEADIVEDLGVFSITYNDFQRTMEADMDEFVVGTATAIELRSWELRYHVAYIWERLMYIENDIRVELYAMLEAVSAALHADIGIEYTKYPASCGGVLTQIEIVQKYYGKDVRIQRYMGRLLNIHRRVIKASRNTWRIEAHVDTLN